MSEECTCTTFYLAAIRQYYTTHHFIEKSTLILFTLVGLGIGIATKAEQPLWEKALMAKAYYVEKRFNTNYCFLIDSNIPSSKKRFFVWDFKDDSIKYSSLCAYGYGRESTPKKPVYNNVEDSYCSSLGKYKAGIRSCNKWGANVHYRLYGLEPTNSNTFKCYIVLHSYTPVPTLKIYPMHLPLGISQGCSVICDDVMRKVDALLKAEKKPVLLWIYE